MRPSPAAAAFWLCLCLACGGDDSPVALEDAQPVPPPGPNWTVLPIPLEKIARITPLGHNNMILPIGHTYWDTCDFGWLMPSQRPCLRDHVPIRAPGDGHHADRCGSNPCGTSAPASGTGPASTVDATLHSRSPGRCAFGSVP